MGLSDTAGGLMRGLGLSDPVIRLGVTGLSRAGKTVFITSLVANLLDRGRMPALRAAADGSIRAAWLQPQPDDTVPRFDFERHLTALIGPDPHWPEGTRHVSELRLSLRVQPRGLFSGLRGVQNLHLDIVDYPGEWLLDLRLMERSFAEWSAETLERMQTSPVPTRSETRWRRSTPAPGSRNLPRRPCTACTSPILRRRARRGFPIPPPAASCCPERWMARPR